MVRNWIFMALVASVLGRPCIAATYGFSPTQINGPLASFGSSLFDRFTLMVPDSVVASGFVHQEAPPLPQPIIGTTNFGEGEPLLDASIRADLAFDGAGNIVGGYLDVATLTTSNLFRGGPVFEFDIAFDVPGDCGSGGFDNGCNGFGSFFLVPGTYSTPEPGTWMLVSGLIGASTLGRGWPGWSRGRRRT